MTAADIIDAFGGTKALADRLELPRSQVSNWRKLGIPARFWFDILDHAEAQGLQITREAVQWRPSREAEDGAAA